MGWFTRKSKDKTEEVEEKSSTRSMTERKQKDLENMLLELVLEAYQKKNFSVEFRFDGDREGKEYKPNFEEYPLEKNDKYREIYLKYIQKGTAVFIEDNDYRNSSYYDRTSQNDYKNGGLKFIIFTKNEEGHIISYHYNNLSFNGGVKNELELRMYVYNNEYHNDTDLDPEYSFERGWSNSDCGVEAEIKRMKKVEKLVMLMVEEQSIDLEARNLSMMDKMLGRSPKKSKRESILRELLEDDSIQ